MELDFYLLKFMKQTANVWVCLLLQRALLK